jgi:hypothetical protein
MVLVLILVTALVCLVREWEKLFTEQVAARAAGKDAP